MNGMVHCWACGHFLPLRRLRAAHPNGLCEDCYKLDRREQSRLSMARLHVRRAAVRGTLVEPRLGRKGR